ncbi:MAG: hypothetical protein KKA19_07645 [Candidatus Margulisbacteria bacterium]|nr:hypothetical protein [Candidatus Margulisiibacteriota bacterium]
MIKKMVLLIIVSVMIVGVIQAKDVPVDVPTEVIPGDLSESEMDAWLSQNQENFDFYVEGRSIAEYRQEIQHKILQARKEAQEKVAKIDERLKEQLTGNKVRDKELSMAAEKKMNKVYQEELVLEESMLNRQLRREVSVMRQKKVQESKIANVQKEFREQLAWMKQDHVQRINAASTDLPAMDESIAQESAGKAKIEIDKNQKINVEVKPYGGEMSDRAKSRMKSR